ncbi:hypothetical protein NUITMVS1_14450 [Shewanella xiamenensis]|nr:hypothetical protein NUITMVS1_14450 [Shewanella xiamenensis]BDQ65536.1 hypothetical protein NUITMVS2_13480 [Shewanella xiamenensis]GLD79813.1 hypothetical protein NUITMVS3_42500 [Shewanella xiamenensis]
MEQHFGYVKHDTAGKNARNSRNGKSRKSVRTIHGDIGLEMLRDRNGSFDECIVSLYARGMSTRDI